MSAASFKLLTNVFGPRVPADELARHATRYIAPGAVMMMARVALLASLFLPYWHMTLKAPQYPEGLHVQAYLNLLEGDAAEIDELNHYIGMRPLRQAAEFERTTAIA